MGKNDQSDADYIADRIKINNEGCWIWQLSTVGGVYGQANRDGNHVYAHRLSYATHVGPIPKGAVVHHVCHEKLCCNPDHLEAVSHHVNIAESLYDRAMSDELLNMRNDYDDLKRQYDALKALFEAQSEKMGEMKDMVVTAYETHNEVVDDYIMLLSGVHLIGSLFDGLLVELSAAPVFDHFDHAGNYEVDVLTPFETITWFECIADWKPEMFSLLPEEFDEYPDYYEDGD